MFSNLSLPNKGSKRGPPKTMSRQERDAREDAVCRVKSGEAEGSGMLVTWAGYTAVLTLSKLVPDRAAAANAEFVFNAKDIGTISVRIQPGAVMHFSPPDELGYAFAVVQCPAGLIPLPLHRGQDCGVWSGDNVSLLKHDEDGGKSVWVGFVERVASPHIYYDPVAGQGIQGAPLFFDYEPVALHIGVSDRARESETQGGGFISALSCAPGTAKRALGRGVLVCMILDDLSDRVWRRRKEPDAHGAHVPGMTHDEIDGSQQHNGAPGTCEPAEYGGKESGGKEQSQEGFAARLKRELLACTAARKQGNSTSFLSVARAPGDDVRGTAGAAARSHDAPGSLRMSQEHATRAHGPLAVQQQDKSDEGAASMDAASLQSAKPALGTSAASMLLDSYTEVCGVGLVLGAWSPKGLALALNAMSGTHQRVRVEKVVEEGPADYAEPRVQAGDILKAVGEDRVRSLAEACNLLRGEAGSEVVLTLSRNGYEYKVLLKRNFIGVGADMAPRGGMKGADLEVRSQFSEFEAGLLEDMNRRTRHAASLGCEGPRSRTVVLGDAGDRTATHAQDPLHSHTHARSGEEGDAPITGSRRSGRWGALFEQEKQGCSRFPLLDRDHAGGVHMHDGHGDVPGEQGAADRFGSDRKQNGSEKNRYGSDVNRNGSGTNRNGSDRNGNGSGMNRNGSDRNGNGSDRDRYGSGVGDVYHNGDNTYRTHEGGHVTSPSSIWDSLKSLTSQGLGGSSAPAHTNARTHARAVMQHGDISGAFRHACVARLHGEIAKEGSTVRQLSRELIDKARVGDAPCVRVLVARGADVNFVDDEIGWGGPTPLIQAATAGNSTCIKALLQAKAQIDAPDEWGWTPLHRSAGMGSLGIVTCLVEAKAHVDVVDCFGMSPLVLARAHGHDTVVGVLSGVPMQYEYLRSEVTSLRQALMGGAVVEEGGTGVCVGCLEGRADDDEAVQSAGCPGHEMTDQL